MLRKKRTLWEEEEKVEKNWSIENVANIFFFLVFFFHYGDIVIRLS